MKEMLSLRNFRLASTNGDVILFQAGVPREVPDALVHEAMAAGCALTNQDELPFIEDQARAKVEFGGDIRRSMIYLAVQGLVETNDVKHFDGGGVPKIEAVGERLGFSVTRDEVRAVFQMYTAAKADGINYSLHPQSQNILRVIDAESKVELVELAEEFGIDIKRARAVSAKEIRKLLLLKFNGNAASM